jgi:hypothetical protein
MLLNQLFKEQTQGENIIFFEEKTPQTSKPALAYN